MIPLSLMLHAPLCQVGMFEDQTAAVANSRNGKVLRGPGPLPGYRSVVPPCMKRRHVTRSGALRGGVASGVCLVWRDGRLIGSMMQPDPSVVQLGRTPGIRYLILRYEMLVGSAIQVLMRGW